MQPTPIGTARTGVALALAALTGCSHTHSTTKHSDQYRPERVERRPDGRHVALRVSDPECGESDGVVVAEGRAMCVVEERGTVTFEDQPTSTQDPFGDLKPAGGAIGFAIAIILLPVVAVISLVAWVARARSAPYVKLERIACGEPPQRVPDLPLRLELRRSACSCAAWSARTGRDGALALAAALDAATTAADPGSCRGQQPPGVLFITGDAGTDQAASPDQTPPAERRTVGEVNVPLSPAQAAALGLEPWVSSPLPVPPPWEGRDIPGARVAETVQGCAHRLDRGCQAALGDCLRQAEEKGDVEVARLGCWYAAPYCEPATGGFVWCLQAKLP